MLSVTTLERKMFKQNNRRSNDGWLKLLLLICTFMSLALTIRTYWGGTLWWDLNPIIQAIDDYSNGLNPYRYQDQSMFIYHPWVLRLLHVISEFVALSTGFGFIYLLICGWFFAESVRFLKQDENSRDRYGVILMAIAFGGMTLKSLLCGNFSAYFHLVLIGLLFNFVNRPRPRTLSLFALSVVCFSLVKPYFLAYTLFYFLVLPVKKAIATSVVCGLALLALWFSGALLFTDQYGLFLQALQYQLIAKDDLGGFSTLRILGPYLGYQWAFLLHVSVVGLVALVTLVRMHRGLLLRDNIKSQALIVMLLIVFVNPRVVFYDFFAGIVLLFYLLLVAKQRYLRILLCGFPIAIYSQLTAHGIRWVILAYAVVFLATVYGLVWSKAIADDGFAASAGEAK